MGWVLDLLGLTQEGDRPILDGIDGLGTQGPAIDLRLDIASPRQRGFYNFLRGIGFDMWKESGDAYAILDGRTKNGDHGPVTFYTSKRAHAKERPAPPAPAPPPGAAMPGYALDRQGAGNYIKELFSDASPRFAYS